MRILIGVVSVVVRGNELRFRTEGDCFLVSFWFFFLFFLFFFVNMRLDIAIIFIIIVIYISLLSY